MTSPCKIRSCKGNSYVAINLKSTNIHGVAKYLPFFKIVSNCANLCRKGNHFFFFKSYPEEIFCALLKSRKILIVFFYCRSAKISRAALWILGEYCEKSTDIQAVMNEVRQSLGEIPIVEDELRKAAGAETLGDESVAMHSTQATSVQKLVTADGTYATQSAFSSKPEGSNFKDERVKKSHGFSEFGVEFMSILA